ncbi:hypothetical protein GEMRC1_001983 [Eukaryota sp. GEM-RC1]
METSPNCLKVGYLSLHRAEAFTLMRQDLERECILLLQKYISVHKQNGLDGLHHLVSHPMAVRSDLLLYYLHNSSHMKDLIDILKGFKKLAWLRDQSDDFIIDFISKHSGVSVETLCVMGLKRLLSSVPTFDVNTFSFTM